MSDEFDPEFLGFAEALEGSLDRQRTSNLQNFQRRLGILWSTRQALVAAIGSAVSRPDKEFPESAVREKMWRAAIHTAVIQGIAPLDSLIGTATYAQACTLVRQEFEAAEALRGIRIGTQKKARN